MRNLTCISTRLADADDEEYVKDLEEFREKPVEQKIEEPEVIEVEEKSEPEELEDMVWRVVYTPYRKPRKKDYSTKFIVVRGKTLEEAKVNAKIEFERMDIPFKEKWCKFYKESFTEIMKDVRKRVKDSNSFEVEELLNDIKEDIEEEKHSSSNKGKMVKIESKELENLQLDIDVDENDYITNIAPKNINIFEMGNYNTYFVNSLDLSFIPNMKVVAKNIPTATLYIAKTITQLSSQLNTSYKNLRALNIFNSKNLKEAATVDIEQIIG